MNSSDAYYRAILEAAVDAIITIDERGVIQSANPATEKIFGYRTEELEGENISMLMPEPHRSIHDSYIHQYLQTGRQRIIGIGRESQALHKDGSIVFVHLAISEVWVEGQRMFIGIVSDISGLKRVENALRKEYDLMQEIMNSANALVLVLDNEGNIARFNRACESLTGYSFDEVRGRPVWELVLSEERAGVETVFNQLRFESMENRHENHWLCKDSSKRLISWSNSVVRSSDSTPNYIIGIGVDVTEQRKAEAAVRDRDDKLCMVLESSPVVFWSVDQDGIFTLSEGMGLNALGLKPGQIVGQSAFDVFNDSQQIKKAIHNALLGEEIVDKVTVFGRRYESYYHPIRDDSGAVRGVSGIAVDETERFNALQSLHYSESRFRILVENAADAFFLHDIEGRILDVNEQACKSLQYSREELVNKNISEIEISGSQQELQLHLYSLIAGETISFEGVFLRRDASRFNVEINLSTIDYDGELRYLALARDVTMRKQTEQKLLEAKQKAEDANRAKSVFLSSMSHELRTPLNAILGFAQILKDCTTVQEDAELAKEIVGAGHHLLDLITDVLDLAKIESGHIPLVTEIVGISELIDECVAMVQSKADERAITLRYLDDHREKLALCGDRLRVRQVLLNLLSNAVKYNNDNGSVTIDCLILGGHRLCVCVNDNGPGIPTDKQRHVFSPFNRLGRETSNIEGTGIGLVVSKRLVELMEGEIGFSSEPGNGSTFWFILPLVENTEEETSAEKPISLPKTVSEASPSTLNGKAGILYIEDNLANLRLVEQVVKNRIPLVEFSSSADPLEGLKLAREKQPQLILLDINLPGINGYEVMDSLKKDLKTKHIPVIALTANAMPNEIREGKTAGFMDYITKPIDVAQFVDVVSNYLNVS